jgi:hypothetical protein
LLDPDSDPGGQKLHIKTQDSELDLDPHPDPQLEKSRIRLRIRIKSMQTRNPAFKVLLGGLCFKMEDESKYSAKS